MRHDPLRGRFLGRGGADVGVEIEPSHAAETHRQILGQSLSDEAQLDVSLVGGELAADVRPVGFGLALHILFAGAAVDGGHVLHPEVISVSPDCVNGLLEADFNFEPPAVEEARRNYTVLRMRSTSFSLTPPLPLAKGLPLP